MKKWLSAKPVRCQLCSTIFSAGDKFVDGKTIYGFWALMCTECHKIQGFGLGIGKGQIYDWNTCNEVKTQIIKDTK